MKTKHRMLSMLTVLALVASLCAVMVAPVGAAPGTAVVTVTPGNHTAGEIGEYTISFIAPAAIDVGGTIIVTFPAGTNVPPTPWQLGDVTVEGTNVTAAGIGVLMRTVSILVPAGAAVPVGGIADVVFTTGAGIVNPPPGSYTLTVAGITSQPYTIGGITAIDPIDGPVGTEVTVTGVGFVPGEPVTVTFDEPPIFTRQVTAPGGTFTTTFAVPAGAAAGAQPVRAVGAHVDHSVNFTVEVPGPVVTLSPATAVPGTTITVSGERFTAGERVLVRWDGIAGMLIGFATTDGAGKFETSINIPLAAPGDHRIYVHVEGVTAVADHATLTIPSPVITLTPAEGPVQQTVTVTGASFPALSTIVIRWRGRTSGHIMLPPEALTNALGAFSTQVTIPVDLSGDRRIYAYVRDFQGPDDLPLIFDWATYTIEPGVPRIGVPDGFHAIWGVLDHSVWVFVGGEWYQHHTDPVMHALIDPDNRFEYLEAGLAYWFYLTEPIENVLVGGVTWTLSAGWHNRGWTP